jgi:hypothetical protein
LPQFHFVHHISQMVWPRIERGQPQRETIV